MNTDRETTRIVRSWLEEGVTALPDRVLDAVLDQVPATQQRPAWWPARRYPDVNRYLKIAMAVAAVVVVAVVGVRQFGGSNVAGPGSSPTPTSSPTPAVTPSPVASASAAAGLPEGSFTLARAGTDGVSAVPMTVIIPAPGWFGTPGDGILVKHENADPPNGAGVIVFGEGDGWYVPSDPCNYDGTMPATRSTTVDDLVAALAAQASRDASAPADITLDGYAGKSITLHVPDDAVFADCDHEKFCTLADPEASPVDACFRYHQGPGQIDEMWVLDVDGQLVVLDWSHYDGTPAADVEELRAIVESTTFE